jgi:hypothetical protein
MIRAAFLAPVLSMLVLGGCTTTRPAPVCPAGQEPMRTAQLFFGQNIGGKAGVSEAAFRRFVDEELTPRFPQGLTVLDGGGQWKGAEDKLIREASKVVVLVLAPGGDTGRKLDEVRNAYVQRFKQDSVLLVTQKACVAF